VRTARQPPDRRVTPSCDHGCGSPLSIPCRLHRKPTGTLVGIIPVAVLDQDLLDLVLQFAEGVWCQPGCGPELAAVSANR
jgi:hypothetical protein